MKRKNTYKTLLALLAIALMLLPFANVFNHLLTRLVEKTDLYRLIARYLVPYLIKLVMVVLRFLGIRTQFGQTMFLVYKEREKLSIVISWNCLGWQSMVIFFVSLLTGLSGKYHWRSKLECLLIGTLGTFLLNLARIVFSVLAIVYLNRFFAYVFHDYLMILVTVLWLFVFWWFSFSFVLEREDFDS